MKKILPALVFTFFIAIKSKAQLRLPAVLSSHMVLQQNDSVMLWGWSYPGDKVFVNTSWNNKTDSTITSSGARWRLKVKTPTAGGPYTISFNQQWQKILLENIMIGEVWYCSGQSNMDWNYYVGVKDMQPELDLDKQNNIRLFFIPKTTAAYPQDDVKAQWAVCDSNNLKTFSAVAYFFAKKLQEQLKVPVGLIQGSWGGTPAEVWVPEYEVNNHAMLKASAEKLKPSMWWPSTPGVIYNAMVAPVTNFTIAGAIWYQGESNTAAPSTYNILLTTMIDAWRKAWQKKFPFYFVQIAPYTYGKKLVGAAVREQQMKASAHENTGMVAIPDLVDDVTDIHPRNKRDVGFRLGNLALAQTYHKDNIVAQYPVYDRLQFSADKVEIGFLYTGGSLRSVGGAITTLEVAGADKVFYPAEGKIDKNVLLVWSKKVKEPVAVRYGFSNAGIGNLFSGFGLPVIPFRTDDWPLE